MFKKSFLKVIQFNIIANKTLQNCVKQGHVHFLLCPKQGLKIEDGVLHRVYILGLFCPKQGQGLKPSTAPLYPTIGQVPPPPPPPPGLTPISPLTKLVKTNRMAIEVMVKRMITAMSSLIPSSPFYWTRMMQKIKPYGSVSVSLSISS